MPYKIQRKFTHAKAHVNSGCAVIDSLLYMLGQHDLRMYSHHVYKDLWIYFVGEIL